MEDQLKKLITLKDDPVIGFFDEIRELNELLTKVVSAIEDSKTTEVSILNQEQPDFSSVEEGLGKVVDAIGGIKFPEQKETKIDLSGVERLLSKISEKKDKEVDVSELKNISRILGDVLFAAQSISSKEEKDIDLSPLSSILSLINENIVAIEFPDFDYERLERAIKGIDINISAGGGSTAKVEAQQIDGTQKTQIVDSNGTTWDSETTFIAANDIYSVDINLVGGATHAGYLVNGQPLSVSNFFIDETTGNTRSRQVSSDVLDNSTLQRIRIKLKKPQVLAAVIVDDQPAGYGFTNVQCITNPDIGSITDSSTTQRHNALCLCDVTSKATDELQIILYSDTSVGGKTVASFKNIQIAVLKDYSQKKIVSQLADAVTALQNTSTKFPLSKLSVNSGNNWFGDEITASPLVTSNFYSCPATFSAFVSKSDASASTKPITINLDSYGAKTRDIYMFDSNYYGFAGVKVEGNKADGSGFVTLFDDRTTYPEGGSTRIYLHIPLPVNDNVAYSQLKFTILGSSMGSLGGSIYAASFSRIEIQEIVDDAVDQNRQLLFNVEAQQTDGSQTGNIVDSIMLGKQAKVTPQRELVSINPFTLIYGTFEDGVKDPNFWTETVTGSGSVVQASGSLDIHLGTTANSTAKYVSNFKAPYSAGSSTQFRAGLAMDSGIADNVRRFGMFTSTDGVFIELNGTTLNLVTRKDSVDTKVASTAWTVPFTLDTNNHLYEFTFSTTSVYLMIDDVFRHKISSTTGTWTALYSLPIAFENINSNGQTTDKHINIRACDARRLGNGTNQAVFKNITSATTTVAKYYPGTLRHIIINSPGGAAGSCVIYDNTAGSGTTIGTIDFSKAANPVTITYECPFNVGLTLVTTGTVPNITVVYE